MTRKTMSQKLANHRIGRGVLHSGRDLRDHHWAWHILGVQRKLALVTLPIRKNFVRKTSSQA